MSQYRLSVCPHDTAKNSVGWFFLNTYLQRKLGCGIHFEPKDNFIQERDDVLKGGYHIVYANPYSAATYIKSLGFLPVARPVGVFDETILVRAAGKELAATRPLRIASATDKLIIHGLGLQMLEKQSIPIADCVFDFVGTHVKAAHAVIQGKADLAFVYNETWQGLATGSREALMVVDETNSATAYHCFCVSGDWADRADEVRSVLCSMRLEPKGQQILDDLQFSKGFEAITSSDIQKTLELMDNALKV
jgi:phosphonate transport system substrate-binding protein